MDHTTLSLIITTCLIVLAAGLIVLVGYLTNWFRPNLQISIFFAGDSRMVTNLSGMYTKLGGVDDLNIRFTSQSRDDIVATFDHQDYSGAWQFVNEDDQTRHFVILKNTTTYHTDKPYIAVIGSASDKVTFYAFGESSAPSAYNQYSDWIRRADGSVPTINISRV